jgi:hypothetical protein
MKLNRSLLKAIVVVALAVCTWIFMGSCASMGDKKEAAAEKEVQEQSEEQAAETEATGAGVSEVQHKPGSSTGASEQKSGVPTKTASAKGGLFKNSAASIKEALNSIIPGTLPELNWNRVATIVGGLLSMALIYGLAFTLARLPARRGGATSRKVQSQPSR